jgi:RimJ/RimL family protein N-acetyltransferase
MTPRVNVTELTEQDLPFLLSLWQIPEVMRYADELPGLRGWSKSDPAGKAWARYQEQRMGQGSNYTQLIVCLDDGTPIGESFFAPLPEGWTLDRWTKPAGTTCLIGDIKLLPDFWGQGLGSEAMQLVVSWLWEHTGCDLLVVPPHDKNPAARRVYEKAGFQQADPSLFTPGHRIMELWQTPR